MEFFHQPNINWMSKTKYFVALSLCLLLVGGIAWVRHGGLHYGIDFKGGTLIIVRFSSAPPIGKIRSALDAAGLKNNEVTSSSDISNPNSRNDVMIRVEQSGEGEDALNAAKQTILTALEKNFGAPTSTKPDFNSIAVPDLANYLTQQDPLHLGTAAGDRYTQFAQTLITARDKEHAGIVTNFDQLSNVSGANAAVISDLKSGYSLNNFSVLNAQVVGPTVGAQLRRQALLATLYALAGMLVYVAFRFEWIYGAAAVIAVFHDVLITLGFFCLFYGKFEISLTVIAALLTLVGYSMNDTIVIFDRVRENLRLMRREPLKEIINRSINQTLSRTILTSGLTFLTVFLLFVFGGQVLRSFSFAMVVGVVVGTYSSFGIAAPIVLLWNKWRGGRVATAPVQSSADKRAEKRLATARR
ncbi:MAG TPA: protein translocase subunit SecF [Candidatus Acidoferrales bacterium]|nr:protein translocase subunit SecF [Candidatus Acidoferrales bacterium]